MGIVTRLVSTRIISLSSTDDSSFSIGVSSGAGAGVGDSAGFALRLLALPELSDGGVRRD